MAVQVSEIFRPVSPQALQQAAKDRAPASQTNAQPLPESANPRDRVTFSALARQWAEEQQKTEEAGTDPVAQAKKEATDTQLSDEEKKQLEEMKRREEEVINHEQAHKATGGQYASAPQYSYSRGPDGAVYIVDGEVSIDLSSVPNDPQATYQKAQQVRAAALAPAQPSGQDLRVAAAATQMAMDAQRQLKEEQGQALQEPTAPVPKEPDQEEDMADLPPTGQLDPSTLPEPGLIVIPTEYLRSLQQDAGTRPPMLDVMA